MKNTENFLHELNNRASASENRVKKESIRKRRATRKNPKHRTLCSNKGTRAPRENSSISRWPRIRRIKRGLLDVKK